MTSFVRNYPLEDITIRSGGDGRTVEAYAAVFNVDTEIHDHQGQYLERISPQAFNRTIAHRGTSFGVFYNHGLTLQGTPSERASLPIGTPEEVRADSRGLYTVTKYNNTPLADEVLEAIRTGAITGQSFSGRFAGSDPAVPAGGFRRSKSGELTVVTRNEVLMTEYGPTPFPAYESAAILGVRHKLGCTCDTRGTTIELEVTIGDAAETPDACDCTCDCCAAGACTPHTSATTPDGAPERSALPDTDSPNGHTGRLLIQRNSIRRQLRERGLL